MNESQLNMYMRNQKNLLESHLGQLIAVKNGEFIGSYTDDVTAYRDMVKRGLKDGEYMIVKCTPGDEAYSSYIANWFVPENADAG